MLNVCVVGASGYVGAELCQLLAQHPACHLESVFVSEKSADTGASLSELHPALNLPSNLILQSLSALQLCELAANMDAIFLATPHEVSHDWIPLLTGNKAIIFDLSGAFRLEDTEVFQQVYGFEHHHSELNKSAIYGLADWHQLAINQASLIAVPGCYPTASLLALKPLQTHQLLDNAYWPVINAVSGVSGAGRSSTLTTSFCEVSLQAYKVFEHRHQAEIAQELGCDVIFTPHLGNFKRGILATISVRLKAGTSCDQVDAAFREYYQHNPGIRLRMQWPKIDDVAGSHFCDLHWRKDDKSPHLIITSAIDNLLKGAATQAMQCFNLKFGHPTYLSLIAGDSSCNL